MSRKTIWGNCVVCNEDRYIYFAILSVIDFLDKIIVYDTGSTDQTVLIIKYLQKKYPNKILFKQFKKVDAKRLTELREQMLRQTKSDWLLILDGDEVWRSKEIKKVIDLINEKGDKFYAFVSPVINLIGDIYHYQDEEAGEYKILGRKGHFNIRAINRKVPGLHIKNNYPLEGFYDDENLLLQDNDKKLLFIDTPYFHFSHLKRSSNEDTKKVLYRDKFKFEIGKTFAQEFKYPEVFFRERPEFVVSPWQSYSSYFKIRAMVETPLKKLKRRLFKK